MGLVAESRRHGIRNVGFYTRLPAGRRVTVHRCLHVVEQPLRHIEDPGKVRAVGIAAVAMTALLVPIATSAVSPTALAPYPTRPLRMIVASLAGTASDCFARVIGDQLGSLYHQQVIIDNRPGAGCLMRLMHKKARRVSAAAGARRTRAYTR